MEISANRRKQDLPRQLCFPGFPENDNVEPYDLVYGASRYNEGLVFIQRDTALELAATYEALTSSSTWGEFKSNYTPESFQEVWELMGYDGLTYESFCEELAEEDSSITEEKARKLYRELKFGERMPLDGEPFNPDDIPVMNDGDWPDWPEQLMLSWIPRDILAEHGLRGNSVLNGAFAVLDSEREDEIVAAFQHLGYRCKRNDGMVAACSGQQV